MKSPCGPSSSKQALSAEITRRRDALHVLDRQRTAHQLEIQRLEAELAAPRRRWLFFVDITAGRERRGREFRHLRRLLEGDDREQLDRLEELYRTKLEIDAHYTLQQTLRLWLYLHVPGALLLVALLIAHLYSVWTY